MNQLQGPRADLAKAIDAAGAAEAHVAGLRASIVRIETELYAARDRLAASKEAEEEASRDRVRALVAGGGVTELARDTRSAASEANGAIDACKEALSMCRAELGEAERDLGLRELRVRSAVGEVIAAERVGDLLADVERLRAELEGRHAVLQFLRNQMPAHLGREIDQALPRSDAPANHESVSRWMEAYGALLENSGAPLP